jgi:hypothetical protein
MEQQLARCWTHFTRGASRSARYVCVAGWGVPLASGQRVAPAEGANVLHHLDTTIIDENERLRIRFGSEDGAVFECAEFTGSTSAGQLQRLN